MFTALKAIKQYFMYIVWWNYFSTTQYLLDVYPYNKHIRIVFMQLENWKRNAMKII